MDRIQDDEIAGLWATHFPKYQDDVSKTLCLAMYHMVTDRAATIVPYGNWSDKIYHSAMFFGVPKDQYYEFAVVANEFE